MSPSPAKPSQKLSADGKPLPDIALKWGTTPSSDKTDPDKPDFSTYYSEEEKERLRAKGVNPELKAEIEWTRSGKGTRSKKGGFWSKVAGTSWGGGWIK